jgi:hypothetical protein
MRLPLTGRCGGAGSTTKLSTVACAFCAPERIAMSFDFSTLIWILIAAMALQPLLMGGGSIT